LEREGEATPSGGRDRAARAAAGARRLRGPLDRLLDRLLGGLIDGSARLVERPSIERSLAVAAAFGRVWTRLGGPRTRRVEEALARALPDRSPDARAQIARAVFVHLAQSLVELLLLRGRRRAELLARVEVVGLEHLAAAARATPSRGVLVVTAHLGNWELACAKVAALGLPVSVVYRELRSPVLDRALFDLRARAGSEPGGIPVEQLRMGRAGLPVLRALEAGRNVLVLLDQNAKREEGVFVPFFGQAASTRSGPVALAALRGHPIVPAFIHREADGRTHRIEIQPALPLEPGAAEDEEALRRNVARVTAAIEAAVRAWPGQWTWTHRRWRTRPRPAAAGRSGPEAVDR
jgi:KDO2-lipid IV(A) lauroyltransferase